MSIRVAAPAAGPAWLARTGLGLLLLIGVLYAFASVSDLAAALRGLPSDHRTTFTALAGRSFADFRSADAGAANYVALLERGYAIHELTFAVLFLTVVAIPFRQRRRWAWWAAWTPMIANIGYTLTFGVHDPALLARALVTDVALPVLLLAHLPAFFGHRDGAAG